MIENDILEALKRQHKEDLELIDLSYEALVLKHSTDEDTLWMIMKDNLDAIRKEGA